MAVATFKCEFPRRQAIGDFYGLDSDRYYDDEDEWDDGEEEW